MKHKFFSISTLYPDAAETALNRFCDQHCIVNIEKQFVSSSEKSHWSVCVTWLEQDGELAKVAESVKNKKPRVDYKEILSEADFGCFSQLRELRSALAEKDGTAVYNVFTNEQLATMVRERLTSRAALLKLDGVGQARIEKYADAFLEHIRQWVADDTPIHQP